MESYKTIVDTQGYIIEKCVVFIDEVIQGVVLKEGQEAVDFVDDTKQVINNRTELLLKSQWNGLEWIETATQEELNLAYPVIKVEPSQDEILRAKILKDNADIQLQLVQQQKLNADILLKLASLGGSTNV